MLEQFPVLKPILIWSSLMIMMFSLQGFTHSLNTQGGAKKIQMGFTVVRECVIAIQSLIR